MRLTAADPGADLIPRCQTHVAQTLFIYTTVIRKSNTSTSRRRRRRRRRYLRSEYGTSAYRLPACPPSQSASLAPWLQLKEPCFRSLLVEPPDADASGPQTQRPRPLVDLDLVRYLEAISEPWLPGGRHPRWLPAVPWRLHGHWRRRIGTLPSVMKAHASLLEPWRMLNTQYTGKHDLPEGQDPQAIQSSRHLPSHNVVPQAHIHNVHPTTVANALLGRAEPSTHEPARF